MYYVFVSDSFKYDENGELIPAPGSAEHVIARNVKDEAEAQQLVRDHDATHEPGELGRYARYDYQRR